MRHHQKADRIHAERARRLDMLRRDIRLGAMGGDAHAARARRIGLAQIVHRADAGNEQNREDGMFEFGGDGGDPFDVVVPAEAVIERRAVNAVAVADFDRIDPGAIERTRDGAHRLQSVLVADGMHAVAQRDVLHVELVAEPVARTRRHRRRAVVRRAVVHCTASCVRSRAAQRSAAASAADVMMSRLPA